MRQIINRIMAFLPCQLQGNPEHAILFVGRETKDDMSNKDIELTPNDYRVKGSKDAKRKEPIFQQGGLAFLLTYIVVGMAVLMAFIPLRDWLLGR